MNIYIIFSPNIKDNKYIIKKKHKKSISAKMAVITFYLSPSIYKCIIQLLTSVPLNMVWYSPADDILTEAIVNYCFIIWIGFKNLKKVTEEQPSPDLLKRGKKDANVSRATTTQTLRLKTNKSFNPSLWCSLVFKLWYFNREMCHKEQNAIIIFFKKSLRYMVIEYEPQSILDWEKSDSAREYDTWPSEYDSIKKFTWLLFGPMRLQLY
jgi:hypothetical protein